MNIPEDTQRVAEPTEGEMAVMNHSLMKRYSSTDEANGRVNPALDLDSESDVSPKEEGPITVPGGIPISNKTTTPSAITKKDQKKGGGAGAGAGAGAKDVEAAASPSRIPLTADTTKAKNQTKF